MGVDKTTRKHNLTGFPACVALGVETADAAQETLARRRLIGGVGGILEIDAS